MGIPASVQQVDSPDKEEKVGSTLITRFHSPIITTQA
jgi:hypothetical protein